MATLDYQKNQKYFKPTSYKGGIVCIVIGMILLFSGNGSAIVIGLLLTALGGFLIYQQGAGRPSDQDIDRQVSAVMSEVPEKALRKLGIDRQEVTLTDPIVVSGYFLGSLGTHSLAKKGKDNFWRTSNFETVVIFFAEQELHAYKYQFSLIADENTERTDVYFYRDVVSISTNSATRKVAETGSTQQETWKMEVFSLTTSGGTAVECSMSVSDNNAERAIQGARQLVRNKKMHA